LGIAKRVIEISTRGRTTKPAGWAKSKPREGSATEP
jgi:hypothetical protein